MENKIKIVEFHFELKISKYGKIVSRASKRGNGDIFQASKIAINELACPRNRKYFAFKIFSHFSCKLRNDIRLEALL